MEDKEYEERVCMCALNKIFGFKPAIALTLIEYLGSAKAVFDLSEEQKRQILDTRSGFYGMINHESLEWAAKELDQLKGKGSRFIHVGDEFYPELLRECEDAPVGLYMKSSSSAEQIFKGMSPLAIVGTRDLSSYGQEWCERIVKSMAASGRKTTIVSGLALGTDICAHLNALESGLPTIAVMATGVETVYPWRHGAYAERIASTPGCALITDYPIGTAPVAMNFLRRNRIIAGMSKATILIESKIKGGGMMTANLSNSYGRDTYALPGRADDLRSQGCNKLIRTRVAEAITDCESLMESLGLGYGKSVESDTETLRLKMEGRGMPRDTVDKAARILLAIKNCRDISLEEISRECGLPYRETSALARKMECDGMINIDMLQRCSIKIK